MQLPDSPITPPGIVSRVTRAGEQSATPRSFVCAHDADACVVIVLSGSLIQSVFFTTPGGLEHSFTGMAALLASGYARPEDLARLFEDSGTSLAPHG